MSEVPESPGFKSPTVAFSPDGELFVVTALPSTSPGTLAVREVATGRVVAETAFVHGEVLDVAFSPGGDRVISASRGRDPARIWDARTGRTLVELRGHAGEVASVAFSPDGRWALTASGDRTARVWDAASGELVGEFDGHAAALLDAQFSADGARVVTSSRDGTAEVQPATSAAALTTCWRPCRGTSRRVAA